MVKEYIKLELKKQVYVYSESDSSNGYCRAEIQEAECRGIRENTDTSPAYKL